MTDYDADLVRMVDQIAQNFTYLSPDQAAARIAKHLRLFWAPAMRDQLFKYADSGGAGLTPQALRAITELRAASA